MTLPNGLPLPVILLANKSDLPDSVVNKEQLDAFCKEHVRFGARRRVPHFINAPGSCFGVLTPFPHPPSSPPARQGFIGWMETSAKANKNIEESVKGLVTNILTHTDAFEAQRLKKASETAQSAGSTISLASEEGKGKTAAGGGCC